MPAPARHPLAHYRARHSLSLSAFAALVPTTKGTISRIENGRREPGTRLLRLLVAACAGEVTADQILNFRPPQTKVARA